jgi:hypothetical protein
LGLVTLELDGAFDGRTDIEVAARAFHVVEFELQGALVAGAQETWQCRGQHDRITHDHVAGCLADLIFAPGNRHDPDSAGKSRNIEHHLGGPVPADGGDAGVERKRRLCRRRTGQFGAGCVATRTDLPAGPLHAVDQLAIEVANFGREPALPR